MNSSALGLSLAGKKPILVHERFDFAVVGMQALLQANNWRKLGIKLPLIVMVIVGHGKGQGPEQANDYREWFTKMEGWEVSEVTASCIPSFEFKDTPRMIVIPRQLYE